MAPSSSSALPATTRYHRWLGWHAPALRRVLTIGLSGLIVILALLPFVPWELAIVAGWDVAAVAFLCTVWPIILRAAGADVEHIAARRDETKPTATLLVVGASTASLFGVGFALGLAGRESDVTRGVLVIFAFCTVIVSWTVINTVFTLRYAHLHVRSQDHGIDFGPNVRAADLSRLRLRRIHRRHDLPGVGHGVARSNDPANGAASRRSGLSVRRRDRCRRDQLGRWTHQLR